MIRYTHAKASLAAGAALLALTGTAGALDLAEDNTLTIGLSSEATAVDPHYHNLGPNNQIGTMIFDGLVNQNARQQLMPGLATEWKPIDDLTWEFKLREGVKFHDGSDFNADDVVCTFERVPNVPNSPASFVLYTKGKTVKKIDDYTVQISTEEPYPLMANDVSTVNIVSNETGCNGSTEDFNSGKATAGTGPWKFVEYVPGDRIVLEANENYWNGAPAFERLVLKPIKSGPARVAALLAGDVDMINDVPTTDIERLEKDDGITLSQGSSNRVIYLHLDQFREDSPHISAKDGSAIKNPLLDLKVRQAISKAISREAIRDRVMEGNSVVAGQLLPEGFFGVSENLEPVAYDPDGAKALLAEAGLGDGFKILLHGPNDRYVNDARILEAVAQMMNRVGIEASVETMPRSVYFSRASKGGPGDTPEFSLILVGWGAGSGEASSPLRSLIRTGGTANRGRYSNADVDAVIDEALAAVDDEKRQALLAKATEMAIEDHAIIPIHYQVNTWALKKGLDYEPRTDEWTLAQFVTRADQ